MATKRKAPLQFKDDDWAAWRAQTTNILENQTKILDTLQHQLNTHTIQEQAYQEKIANFMMESSTNRTETSTRTIDLDRKLERYIDDQATFQVKLETFILESVRSRAATEIKTTDIKLELDKHVQDFNQHKFVLDTKLDQLKSKLWLALGASGVYLPIITYLAVKLIEHLVTGQ